MSIPNMFKSSSAPMTPPELHEEMKFIYEHVVAVAFALYEAFTPEERKRDLDLANICAWGNTNFNSRKESSDSEKELKRMMNYAKILFQKLPLITLEQLRRCNISRDTVGTARTWCTREAKEQQFGYWPNPANVKPGNFGKRFVYEVFLLVTNMEDSGSEVPKMGYGFNVLNSPWKRQEISWRFALEKGNRDPSNEEFVQWIEGISKFTK